MVLTEAELRMHEASSATSIRRSQGYPLRAFQEDQSHLQFLDVSSPGFDTPGNFEEGSVDDTTLSSWFEKSSQCGSSSRELGELSPPPTRLRLLYASSPDTSLPFTAKALAIMSEHLDLSFEHYKTMSGAERSRLMGCWKDSRQPDQPCTAYVLKSTVLIGMDYGQLLLFAHYNPKTNVSLALLLGPSDYYYVNKVVAELQSSYVAQERHPFSVAMAVCRLAVPANESALLRMSWGVWGMFDRFGYSAAEFPHLDVLEVDFMKETQKIQVLTLQLSAAKEVIQRQLLLMKRILVELDLLGRSGVVAQSNALDDVQIKQTVANFESENESLMLMVERTGTRIGSLSQMLFSFMALKEGRVNNDLAKSSKTIAETTMKDSKAMKSIAELSRKDSSAMKAIAILTMVFLPATGVAAVLDTPFFWWDETTNKLGTRDFHLFWAVAIPLTVGVLLLWRLAIKYTWRKVFVGWNSPLRRPGWVRKTSDSSVEGCEKLV